MRMCVCVCVCIIVCVSMCAFVQKYVGRCVPMTHKSACPQKERKIKVLRIGDVENSVKAIQEVSLDFLSLSQKEKEKENDYGPGKLDEKLRETCAHKESVRILLDKAYEKKKEMEEGEGEAKEMEAVKKEIRDLMQEKHEVNEKKGKCVGMGVGVGVAYECVGDEEN